MKAFKTNLRKRKWLLNSPSNLKKSQISHHLEGLSRLLDEYSMARIIFL